MQLINRKNSSICFHRKSRGYTRKKLDFIDYWHRNTFKKTPKDYSSLIEESSRNSIQSTLDQVEKGIFPPGTRLARIHENIGLCGTARPWLCSDEGCLPGQERTYLPQYCGYRICKHPRCIAKRDRILMRKYEPKLNNFKDPRFITLTLKGYHPLDKVVHQELNYAWKRLSLVLRKSGFVKAYIKVTELIPHEYVDAHGEYQDVYFWHLHIVYDGVYIAADVLRSAWKHYTKGSMWVHIERVKKNISAMGYIRKYLSKLVYDTMTFDEYAKVFKMKLVSHWACKDELETSLEISILIDKAVCSFCGSSLIPDFNDSTRH